MVGDSITVASKPALGVAGTVRAWRHAFHVAYILPYSGESLVLTQPLPVDLDSVLVSVEKWGTVDFVSRQVERRMEIPSESSGRSPYTVGAGPAVRTGEPLVVELVGLPHRSTLPSTVTLVIASSIVGLGFWGAFGATGPTESKGRQALEVRREKLFTDLVKIERQHRAGKIGATKYSGRRRDLVRSLEKVYHQLDKDGAPHLSS